MNRFTAYLSELKKLDIDSYQLYQHYYQLSGSLLSNSCFLHRICWNEGFDYYYLVKNNYLCLVADDNAINHAHLVYPLGEDYDSLLFQEVIFFWVDIFKELNIPFRIEFIDDAAKEILEGMFLLKGIKIQMQEETNCFDYVYNKNDILCVNGKKNRFKRSLLHQLEAQEYDVIDIKKEFDKKNQCLELNRIWLEWKRREQQKEDFDEYALEYFWNNAGGLDYVCYALRIKGVVQAYFVASINKNVLTFHFAKSNRHYRFANFALQHIYIKDILPESVKYINHEDDMGDAGLQYFKQHLGSYTCLKKYSLVVI